MRQPWRRAIPALVLVLAAGCADKSATPERAAPTSSSPGAKGNASETQSTEPSDSAPTGQSEAAVLTGRVLFHGKVPPPRKITVTKDVEHCQAAGGEVQEVVVSSEGGLADVVVEIRGVKPSGGAWEWKEPEGGYVLHQKGCSFHPRLLVMPNGADLHVFNDDPVSHNINTGQWNVLQPSGEKPIVRAVTNRGPVRVSCNIHSWMEAWIYPVQSPFYAVTGKDGTYRIEDVPAGEYRVSVWHANLGSKRLRAKLASGETVEKEVVYESPVGQ